MVKVGDYPNPASGGVTITMSNVAKGLSWMLNNYRKYPGPTVVHCSAVSGDTFKDATLVKNAVNKLLDKGVPVVVPAGNYSDVNVSTIVPANQSRALTVGAAVPISPGQTEVPDLTQLSWTSYGAGIDVLAPGVLIRVASWYQPAGGSRIAVWDAKDGTSSVAPFVTGVVAEYLQTHPKAKLIQVSDFVRNNAKPRLRTTDLKGSPNLFLYAPPAGF